MGTLENIRSVASLLAAELAAEAARLREQARTATVLAAEVERSATWLVRIAEFAAAGVEGEA